MLTGEECHPVQARVEVFGSRYGLYAGSQALPSGISAVNILWQAACVVLDRYNLMGAKASVPNSVFVTLRDEVHEQMFQSGGQPDVKLQYLVPKHKLGNPRPIYRPTKRMKGGFDRAQLGV
ncbi:hypothetical protein TNCV_4765451 [Trichonephila clavipes]|nr:hypothetical protein TNCV_4765451 [Trichonephila clavipes]